MYEFLGVRLCTSISSVVQYSYLSLLLMCLHSLMEYHSPLCTEVERFFFLRCGELLNVIVTRTEHFTHSACLLVFSPLILCL